MMKRLGSLREQQNGSVCLWRPLNTRNISGNCGRFFYSKNFIVKKLD